MSNAIWEQNIKKYLIFQITLKTFNIGKSKAKADLLPETFLWTV